MQAATARGEAPPAALATPHPAMGALGSAFGLGCALSAALAGCLRFLASACQYCCAIATADRMQTLALHATLLCLCTCHILHLLPVMGPSMIHVLAYDASRSVVPR